MKMVRWLSVAATLACAVPAAAQSGVASQCTAGPGQDVCQKSVDLFTYMTPQLGTSLTGTSAIIGQGGTLGGLGHFALDVRANVLMGSLPDLGSFSADTGSAKVSNIKTNDQPLGLPAVDLAVGLFKGLPLGVTNILGIDALVTATYIPEVTDSNSTNSFSISPVSNALKMGYGARVGLLQESLFLPGVSVSYMQRDLPELNLAARNSSGGNTTIINVDTFSVKTTAIRLQASKSLVLFRLSAGVGQDTYKFGGRVRSSVTVPLAPTQSSNFRLPDRDVTRTVVYGGVGLNLLLFKLYAEAGQVMGGDILTYNKFTDPADKTRLFGSVGLRFGF